MNGGLCQQYASMTLAFKMNIQNLIITTLLVDHGEINDSYISIYAKALQIYW